MPASVILFFIGILLTSQLKILPNHVLILTGATVSLLLILLTKKALRAIGILGCGLAFALFYAQFVTKWALPRTLENRPVLITGYIDSIPCVQSGFTSFDFALATFDKKQASAKIHLSWRNCPYNLKVGDYWQFMAKIKQIHGLCNAGGFNQAEYAFRSHLRGTGSVLNGLTHHTTSVVYYPVQKIRQSLQEKIARVLGKDSFYGLILALVLGISSYITPAQWQVFRVTGTSHLVAISGLHIAMVAVSVAKMVGYIWRFFPSALLIMPVLKIEMISGSIVALVYSLLAGFSPSTQRTFLMMLFVLLATLFSRRITTIRSLYFSLGIILIMDPFVILNVGFWLSFLAVMLLIYGMNSRLSQSGRWYLWLKPQWVVTIGMMPTLFLLFQQASLLSLPANIIAIPAFNLFIVPSCLIGTVLLFLSEQLGEKLLHFSSLCLNLLWEILIKISHYTDAIWHKAFLSTPIILLTHLSAYVALLPKGFVSFYVPLLLCLPFALPVQHPLPVGGLQLTVLDVGQGLAVFIKTQQHQLIFDTGAKISDAFDMGKAVIIPYLVHAGITQIDALVISHGDNDHIGGAQSILEFLPVSKVITSVPSRFTGKNIFRCVENQQWQWDGVTFTFLSPPKNTDFIGNNTSCVLKISNQKHSILLTGDIEKVAEQRLVLQHREALSANILLAPHHGSKTSSTIEFVRAVAPQYVIFSTGYLNRYHHPHPDVVTRYQARRINILDTVASGAITMTLLPDSGKVELQEYRKITQKIWH